MVELVNKEKDTFSGDILSNESIMKKTIQIIKNKSKNYIYGLEQNTRV